MTHTGYSRLRSKSYVRVGLIFKGFSGKYIIQTIGSAAQTWRTCVIARNR